MPVRLDWTAQMDGVIIAGWTTGLPWWRIANLAGVARSTVIERARRLGIEVGALPPVVDAADCDDVSDRRRPKPPGDRVSWGALILCTPSIDTAWPGPVTPA